MESDPPVDRLHALIGEFDREDPEHPDVRVSHKSDWTLSAYSDGLLVWENVEDGEPRHIRGVPGAPAPALYGRGQWESRSGTVTYRVVERAGS